MQALGPRTGRLRPQEESGDLTALAQGALGPVRALAQPPEREWAEVGAERAWGALGSCMPPALRLWPHRLTPLALGISSLGCVVLMSGPPPLMGRHGGTYGGGRRISWEAMLLIPSYHDQPCSGQGTETCPPGMGVGASPSPAAPSSPSQSGFCPAVS